MSTPARLTTQDVRAVFLDYFKSQDHLEIGGTSLIPDNDPTLLLINSGMAPLKRYFTGDALPPAARLCNVQSCIRTVDIDDVGDDTHLTFFEMLGNWSIGDYGRAGAVHFAKQLLVDRLGLPSEKLFATVYRGNADLGIPADDVSRQAWLDHGFKADRIVPLGDEDSFWGPAGDTGPCGPCSEVFIDTGRHAPSFAESGHFNTQRYVEIWNAVVFMTLNKNADGTFSQLPFNSIDSGAGLERLTMALNGKTSVYEVEPYNHMLDVLPAGIAMRDSRILVDHMRAAAHLIADRVYPGRAGRDYITRRLLRRMETIAAGQKTALTYASLMDVLCETDGQNAPVIVQDKDAIRAVMETEAKAFGRVLAQGAKAVDKALKKAPALDAKTGFDIVTSVGLPVESLERMAADRGVSFDRAGYDNLLAAHKDISRRPAGTPKTSQATPTTSDPA